MTPRDVELGVDLGDHVTEVLRNLAQLAWHGVRGCDGASVSVVEGNRLNTLAATESRIADVDAAQYRQGDGPCVAAMRDGRPVIVKDYRGEQRWPEVAADAVSAGIGSSLSLPLPGFAGQRLDTLNMYGDVPSAFGEAERRTALIFVRHAMLVLAELQSVQRERDARAREQQVAAALRHSLLPTLPQLAGITSAARYLVSQEQAQVGGDWYDLFALPDGAVGLAIGDVAGHDVVAAAAMGHLRSVLRSYADEGSSPSVVLDRMDRLVQRFDMAQAATAIFGRLLRDQRGATLLFANAGHLPPIVRLPGGSAYVVRGGTSALIGLLPPDHQTRGEASVALQERSLLLLYTVGLVEARQRDVDAGITHMCAAVDALDSDAEPDEVCDALVGALVDADHEDDVALLALRIDALPS